MRLLSSYVLETDKLSEECLRNLLRELIGPKAEVTAMSTAERIRREAHRKGLEQGIEQGKRSGQVGLVLRQLVAKFGALPDRFEDRVRSATAKDLYRWAVAVLTANSLEQVFAG